MNLDITPEFHSTAGSATVRVAGDLDYGSTPALLVTAKNVLAENPTLRDLRFELDGLTFCDSAGLSAFIQIHRLTSSSGVQMHLDGRPAHFERMLEITGILEHLTAPPSDADATDDDLYEGGGSNS